MKSGCSGTLKPDRLGLSCKANNFSDAGTEELGALTAHETSPWVFLGDAGSTLTGLMPPQVKVTSSNENIDISLSPTMFDLGT